MNDNIKCGYFEPIQKIGSLTFFDKINIICTIILSIAYGILIIQYTYLSSDNSDTDNINIKISFVGLLLSLFITSFIFTYVLREFDVNIVILLIMSIISFVIIFAYYINTYIKNNSISFTKFSHIIFPLLGTLFLIIQYTWVKLHKYF
jgi:hypothetical protein